MLAGGADESLRGMAGVYLGGDMRDNAEFEEFWDHYPRRVGKLAAQRAYQRARKQASADAILAGVIRATFSREMRFVPHPATWLNQGRWMDEDATPTPAAAEDWYAECQRLHGGRCGLSQYRHHLEMLKAKAS